MSEKSMLEYKIGELRKMISAENADSGKYGANLNHWSGAAKPINIDLDALMCLYWHYIERLDKLP